MNMIRYIINLFLLISVALATDFDVKMISKRNLPEDVIEVLNYDRIVTQTKDIIFIKEYDGSSYSKVIFDYPLPAKTEYLRSNSPDYIVMAKRGEYFEETLIDLSTMEVIPLRYKDGNAFALQVSATDGLIGYQTRTKEKGATRSTYLYNRREKPVYLMDDIMGLVWAPNGKWFLANSTYGRRSVSRVLVSREGERISLPTGDIGISGAIWSPSGDVLIANRGGEVTIIGFDWVNGRPERISYRTEILNYNSAVGSFFSPNGEYVVWANENNDSRGHNNIGYDIMISDKYLSQISGLIVHENILEIPITWTQKNGLVTRLENQMISYKISTR